MFEFIRTLQEKPRSSRKRIAAATSVGITAFIAMIWLTTFVGPTDSTAGLYSKDSEKGNSPAASPLVALKENISRTFTSVQNKIDLILHQEKHRTQTQAPKVNPALANLHKEMV
ncbi:MAG: hypothetical protein BRC24_01470 [Parcubacteria group bacterium SW_4_46_8]|nr:MAG: hypothetical protein BRC24_01470 [Parcubacteria group bacterium SW_4_46_8]